MAQIGFGLGVNDTVMQSGFDQYQISFGEVMGATAEETWARNPLSATQDLFGIYSSQLKEDSPLISKEDLNSKYKHLGLNFESDEYESVVNIMVEEKQAELQRQSIIARGPQGIGVGVAKFAVGLGVSMLDPINIASAFIPVVGQARMAEMVAKQGFTKARFARGVKEGAVGAAVVEPLVALAANELQADYGLVDSFLNITFGSILGGGLHVGAGKLKDRAARKQFNMEVRQARKALGKDASKYRDAEINLYAKYYPENSKIMRDLERTDPQTRKVLLEKGLNDLLLEKQVDVSPIVDADPALKQSSETSAKPVNRVDESNIRAEVNQSTAANNTANKTDADFDAELENLSIRLEQARKDAPDLKFDKDAEDVKLATDELDETIAKQDDLNATIKDAINCMNGR